jgi:lantibiotic modifying enzyme
MDLNDNDLADIVVESASLRERLTSNLFLPARYDGELIKKRWSDWASSLSRQRAEFLDARVALSGWEASFVKPLLGNARLRQVGDLPDWIGIFRDAVSEARKTDWSEPEVKSTLRNGFYIPFLKAGRKRLRETAGDLLGLLRPGAMSEPEHSLIRRLAAIADGALAEAGLNSSANGVTESRFSKWCYETPDFFQSYPVAARLLSQNAGFWAEAITEFLQRFNADFPEIRQNLFSERELGKVASLSGFASDSHCGGRGVIIVHFEGADQLVYKPRSLGLEAAYFDLARWLAGHGAPVCLKAARAIDHGKYGWMEFIEAGECGSQEEVARYYRRMGGLLALSHALAGADLHFENLIAQGEHPIAIDTEVWMAPALVKPEIFGGEAALERAWEIFRESVLTAAILPAWIPVGRDRAWNIGATKTELGYLGVVAETAGDNLPRINGNVMAPDAYRDSILQGFRETYLFLLTHRENILANGGPLEAFHHQPVRFVNRPTELYGRALRRSFSPDALRSGLTRSFQLEAFLKPALHAAGDDRLNQLAIGDSEIRALERGDVPFFQGRIGTRNIRLPEIGQEIPDFFTRDGLETAALRLRNLSEEDLNRQAQFITVSYDLLDQTPRAEKDFWPPNPIDFQEEANAIVRAISQTAICVDGGAAWIAPKEIAGEHFALAPVDISFYDGTLGAMVFLLAAERVTGNAEAGKLARSIFQFVAGFSNHSLHQTLRHSQLPGLMGLGGQIYALCLGHRLCGESRMLELARSFGSYVTKDFIRQPAVAGLLRGSAGMLLAVRVLAAETNESRWRDLAKSVQDHVSATEMTHLSRIEGIALAGMIERDDGELLAAAAQTANRPELRCSDQFYSGNSSRANFLIAASQQLTEPRFLEMAANLMRSVVARAKARGGYLCYGNHPPSVTGPGFFQGLAGIGYTFLRLVDPSLPGILV